MINKLEQFKDKILWFIIPFLITFFTWLVISISTINGNVQSIKAENVKSTDQQDKMWSMIQNHYNSTDERGQKMWEMIQDNNRMLESKADEQENKKDHLYLSTQLLNLTYKVDRIYVITNYSDNGLVLKKDE